MKTVSRRSMLKASLMAPAAVVAVNELATKALAMTTAGDGQMPVAIGGSSAALAPLRDGRERLLMDFGWRFHLGHATDVAKDFGFGAGQTGNFQKTGNFLAAGAMAFDDSDWKDVDLPHDWAIELPFKNDPSLGSKGYYPLGKSFPDTSVGWYRKVFEIEKADEGKRIVLDFDGAYRETMVVFNGFYIGTHRGGYDPFHFDVTDFVNWGERNVLLVRVDATLSDGWFYEGAGLYRHLWLDKCHPVHVAKWGTAVKTKLRAGVAELQITTEIENSGHPATNVRVISTIFDPNEMEVARNAAPIAQVKKNATGSFQLELDVKSPKLWSLEERNLYRTLTEVEVDGVVVDHYNTRFGIREIKIDAAKGLLLNGKPVKVRGTCNHQDHAAFGAALPDAVQRYRVEKLQEMGCNSLRTSHNPATTELLDACDEMGMLVFEETRMMSSTPEGISQFTNMVRRDRNHPSIFMWSMGNEEGTANTDKGLKILTAMKSVAYELDGSRPVSIAPTGAIGSGGLEVCDVVGYNYMDPGAEAYHKEHPERPVIGTETVSAVCTRGIYITDAKKGFVSSYDPYTTTGRASAEGWWRFCSERDWLLGGFIWTGFDYRGEPSPNQWPNISSQYGIIDMCGFPKDSFFYYQSWWTKRDVLHLFPHWNWPGYEGKVIAVWVYSNYEQVELLVNGKSLGVKDVKKDQHVSWNVEYHPGVIEARGVKGGKVVASTKRETTGAGAKLVAEVNRKELRADGEDVAMISVCVLDEKGRLVPIAENEVSFEVEGAARLAGTGNGDPTDQTPDHSAKRKVFGGLAMGLVQSAKKPGSIRVTVKAEGLQSATVELTAKEVKLRPQLAGWIREVPKGEGVTGLWRPVKADGSGSNLLALFMGVNDSIFTLVQQGGKLSGSVEGMAGSFFGGSDLPETISESEVSGSSIRFKAGQSSYEGKIVGDRLELEQKKKLPLDILAPKIGKADPSVAIGPAPDGSDPSIDPSWLAGGFGAPKLVLERVKR